MNSPYEHEIAAIKALTDAQCALLQLRDVNSYSINKMLEAINTLSETIIAKAKYIPAEKVVP